MATDAIAECLQASSTQTRGTSGFTFGGKFDNSNLKPWVKIPRSIEAAQVTITSFADVAEPILAAAGVLLRHGAVRAEKSRPDRKAFGLATLATKAVASAGPTPGIA